MRDTSRPRPAPLPPLSFDGALGRQIVELHMWVVREGIGGAAAAALFDGLCQRLVIAGVPLWRAFIGMPTLHPHSGAATATPGGEISTPLSPRNLAAATSTSRSCSIAPSAI